jgi:hypothetical protein
VSSGDPNLSNRIQPDVTLAFVDHDHTYQGPALPVDPLAVLREMARAIRAKGVRSTFVSEDRLNAPQMRAARDEVIVMPITRQKTMRRAKDAIQEFPFQESGKRDLDRLRLYAKPHDSSALQIEGFHRCYDG